MKNGQAYQQKMEKLSVSEEKKFGKIDSRRQSYKSILKFLDDALPPIGHSNTV